METAGRLVDEEALREALKEKGLGTPATRAAIIETLLKRDYIRREKKNLTATDLGRYLIAVVRDQDLKSPELTGQWEAKLRQIEAGRLDSRQFMSEIADYTRRILAGSATDAVDDQRLGECPRCGRPVVKGKQAYGCSGWRDGCPFVLQPTWQDQPLLLEEIRCLLQHRVLIAPRPSRDGGDVILALTDTGHVTDIPLPHRQEGKPGKAKSSRRSKSWGARKPREDSGRPAKKTKRATRSRTKPTAELTDEGMAKDDAPDAAEQRLGKCPLCGGDVVEQKKSFSCGNWRDGCRFVIWKTIAGKRITARLAQSLIENGQTDVLTGFKSKAGKPFDARLKLVDGEVKFEFPDRA
jgi:DNA topoisomerase-3